MQALHIHGAANVLCNQDDSVQWKATDVLVTDGLVAEVGCDHGHSNNDTTLAHATSLDATGLLVLPGIVDIHGDAFERQIQPRPETVFSHDIAMAETDRQLIVNGITTACHGLTFSWEGGLRGRDAALAMLRQVSDSANHFQADHRIHLRFENHHVDGLRDALDWISQGWVSLLAFNDHLPSIARKMQTPEKLAIYAERARCSTAEFRARLEAAQSRAGEVADVIEALAAECRRNRIPMLSHDDETAADRLRYQDLGVAISEFPRTPQALTTAMGLSNMVVMGAPNVLLGGSHCGGMSATTSISAQACHILASDYYYPSLLHAPFKLAFVEQVCTLAQAWQLVSENPAKAMGLRNRGRIAPGCRADLILVEASVTGAAKLVATIVEGQVVYCSEPARLIQRRLPLAA
ncbi:alpha-D-ribose 1-methylphosphonate 5-triphosphate diphosphatase [Noviherbaspirillum sp. Root189]|uniref:alpha-D-ribose 1-methylphosphonate 5-triphosphate diphosphatase n=1 Tax=Noviherbaspirillum sp. Root189 TaxID=1736487 RepID=UPI00070F9969|nr:alpha-D-ribose 1-methylphosphonate 5-triphosphate diphosphatase [Noviherbaspirillum sp. Root189]KRB93134.1 hypothetical protein ASE07_14300 [Noviherbaspirillum sp. Root189]